MEQQQLENEIFPTPSCPTMDPQLVKVLTDLCFQKEELVSSDLLFVFGSNVKHREIAAIIAKLISKKLVDQVIITGGVANFGNSYFQNKPESETIYSFLPEEWKQQPIILETRSKNMLENMIEAQKLCDFEHIQSITFICHSYATKRAALSLKRFFPNAIIYGIPLSLPSDHLAYPIQSDTWFKTKYGQSLILGEYLRLITFGRRGDFSLEEIQPHIDLVENLLLNK